MRTRLNTRVGGLLAAAALAGLWPPGGASDEPASAPSQDARALGDALRSRRDLAQAAEAYARMAREAPDGSPACALGYSLLGEVEYEQGRYPAARAAWEQALAALAPNARDRRGIRLRLADSYLAEGRWAEAREAYARVLEADGADAAQSLQARIGIGQAAYEAGDYPAVESAYLALVADRQQTREIVERLDMLCRLQAQAADALLAAGQPEAARAQYEKLFAMKQAEPHHQAAARLGIGRCLEAAKDYGAARAAYAEALAMPGALWPDKGRAQLGIARCRAAEGNRDEARAAYAALLEMPNVSRFDRAEARARLDAWK